MRQTGWEVDEEVNQDKNEADGMNLEVDSKDEVIHHRQRMQKSIGKSKIRPAVKS